MSDATGIGHRGTATAIVHESYSFACMRCGHGWEQSYEIEHHVNSEGNEFVEYYADGFLVPSPLTAPSCHNCGGHIVRIMRPGRVSSARNSMAQVGLPATSAPQAGPITPAAFVTSPAGHRDGSGDIPAPEYQAHSGEPGHWHPLAALRRLFTSG